MSLLPRALLLILLALAVHAPGGVGRRFLLDDGVQIYKNPAVTDGAPFAAYFLDKDTTSSRADYNTRIYRPLRNLTWRGIAVIFGIHSYVFVIFNLLLYVIGAIFIWRLLAALTDERAAIWAAAVWVVLPVHVEPVAYASALGDLLSLDLLLAALIVALKPTRLWRVVLSAALAFLAMLAKEAAIMAPALVVLMALARRRPWREVAPLVAAHGVFALAYLGLRTHVVGALGQDPISLATLAGGLREAPILLARYALLSLEPLGHAASYRVATPGWGWSLVAVALTAALLWLSWRRSRTLAVGLAWFVVALVPVLHLVPLWADLADRFALVASVGLALALAALVAPWRARAVPFALVAVIVLYGAASLIEARAWQSDRLLWRYAVDRQPDAPLAHANLAVVFLEEGNLDEAARELDSVRRLGFTRADLELRRAYVHLRLHHLDEAAAAAQSLQQNPTATAHAILGQIAVERGDRATALGELAAAKASPAHPSVGLLGFLLQPPQADRIAYLRALQALSFDDAAGAVDNARQCLRLSADRPQCQAALAEGLLLAGEPSQEARDLISRAMPSLPESERRKCRAALYGAGIY